MSYNNFVSVIIPNYNHAPFLRKRIDSVLNQTYQNFEVIILDDCSTDNSREVIEQFRNHPKVSHTVFNNINSGNPFFQWKKGIELAQGDLIWIAESDDYSDLLFLEEVVKRFDADKTIGMVYCDSNVVENDCVLLDFYKNYKNDMFNTDHWKTDFNVEGILELTNYLLYENTINNTSAMVFKKSLIQDDTFFNLNLFKYSGDWYFFVQLAYKCNVAYISNALNYFRSGPDNFKKGTKSYLNYFRERSLVRLLFFKKHRFDKSTKSKVSKALGKELKYQLYDLIKGKIHLKEFYSVLKQLYHTNHSMFIRQITGII